MKDQAIEIRNAYPSEHNAIGRLMVEVYAQIEGFPKPDEQPGYYKKLLHVGDFTKKENTELIVALSEEQKVLGAVVYFSDMKHYGSGGPASTIQNSSGFRLLAVTAAAQGRGVGKLLCLECIHRAQKLHQKQVIIHSTASMHIARRMYEKLGFERYEAIDFMQGELAVFGFRLNL